MKRPTISLAMIAKNEEHNLPALFYSVEGCFDEMILVDTGSTDNTVKLAEKFGCKVFHFDWVNDFSKARQFAFDQATSDYILWIDADDSLRNREAFINWRDHVMHLSDYWLANYHYSFDFAQNQPKCTFLRERVVKRDAGFKWKYFVHEGLIKEGPVQPQFTGTWDIVHRRSEEDLKKDRNRNLDLFSKQTGPMDARMTHYWGKELFENGHYMEAVAKLSIAFQNPELQHHDRVLCIQFMAMSFIALKQYDKAIEMAQAGILLSPHRAEFHVIMGDAKVQQGRISEAIPFFAAAKFCIKDGGGNAPFIFSTDEAYSLYPRLNLAKIYANLNMVEHALKEVNEAMQLHDHPELQPMKDALESHKKAQVFEYQDAKPCDDILISCFSNAYPWDGEIYRTKGIGGSETSEVELAENWAKMTGRPVIIYNSVTEEKTVNGVTYRPIHQINEYVKAHKPWIHIAWRHNLKLTNAPTIVHSHDLQTPGIEKLDNYDKVAVLSDFHANFMTSTQSVPKSKMFLTRNGIVPERFENITVEEKDPYSFSFSSSPDRGLDRAMLVLDEVRKIYPKITLKVFYGIEALPQYGLQDLHDKLKSMMEERKDWVTYYGKTEQIEMMKHFRKVAYVVQPSSFLETFGISALEMICSGIYPIFRNVGGIANTLQPFVDQGMATLVSSDCIKPEEFDLYVKATLEALQEERYKRVKVDPQNFSWEDVAKEWLTEIQFIRTESGRQA